MENQATARMLVAMNKSFGTKFGANAFNINHAVNDKTAQIVLYSSGEMEYEAQKYFLIKNSPHSLEEYRQNYESQNFNCEFNK